MKVGSGNRLWIWLVIALVVCNLALIATIWLKPSGSGNCLPPPPPPQGPGANFNRQLDFTSEQNEKFDQMRLEQRAKIDSLKRLAKNVREQFFASIKTGTANPAQLDSMSTVLGNYHKLIEMQTYTHFSEVRAMLTDKQKVVFDSIIIDVLKSLPEQPHFKGDGSRRGRPGGYGPPPPPGERFNHPPPPPPGEGDGPPPHDGDEPR